MGGIIRQPGERSRGRLRTGLHMQIAGLSHRWPVPPAKVQVGGPMPPRRARVSGCSGVCIPPCPRLKWTGVVSRQWNLVPLGCGLAAALNAICYQGAPRSARGRIYAGGIIRQRVERSRGRLRKGLHMQNAGLSHRWPCLQQKLRLAAPWTQNSPSLHRGVGVSSSHVHRCHICALRSIMGMSIQDVC